MPKLCSAIQSPCAASASAQSRLFAVGSPKSFPPDCSAPAHAAESGKFIGKNDDAKGNHPESENRQETQNAKNYEQHPDRDSKSAQLGHSEIASENFDGFLLGRFILATRLSSINRHLTASVVVELIFA